MRSSFTVSVLALLLCSCIEGKPATAPTSTSTDSTSSGSGTSSTVSAIQVSPTAIAGTPGQTDPLSATVLNQSGQQMTAASVTWASTDTSIATVSSSGVVTLLTTGSAQITATAGHLTARVPTTVSKKTARVAEVIVSPTSLSLYPGGTSGLTAQPKDSVNESITGQPITWSSSNTKVATVSTSGVVTAVAIGTAVITATTGVVNGHANVTVSAAPVASVAVNPTSASIVAGKTQQLTATAKTAAGTTVTSVTPTWSSNNTGAATVSSAGLVTGVAAGSATVTVSVSGLTATASITVTGTTSTPAPVASVAVSPASVTLAVGATQQASATDKSSSGATTTGTTPTWKSSNTGIATVSTSGLITAVAAGTATITATSSSVSGTSAVTVTAATGGGSTGGPAAAWPNQPSGMTEWTNRPFSAMVEDGWESDLVGQAYITSDGTSPQSAPNFLRIVYPPGLTGGSTPFQQEKSLPTGQTQTYAEMWIRYSANWVPDNANVMKVLYVWDDDTKNGAQPAVCFCTTEGGAGANFIPSLRIQDNVTGSASNYVPNTSAPSSFAPNTWVHMELYLKMNTPGGGNGVYKLWMNGQLVANYTNITYASTGYTTSQRHWYSFQLAPYWGGGGGTVATSQYMDIDHLYGSAAP